MAAYQGIWPVSVLREVLNVSHSGFYAYLSRHAKALIDAEEIALLTCVKAIAAATRYSYGSRCMARQLKTEVLAVGRAKARRLMSQAGVAVQRPQRRGSMTTDSRRGYEVAPNLLAHQFDVMAHDHVWAGDITSRWTAEG